MKVEKIKTLAKSGLTYSKIARETSTSRQRVHQIVTGYSTNKNKLNKSKMCSICTFTEKLHTHHLDGNFENNDRNNLITLCDLCHKIFHLIGKHREKYVKIAKDVLGIENEKNVSEQKIILANSLYQRVKKKIREKQSRVSHQKVLKGINCL